MAEDIRQLIKVAHNDKRPADQRLAVRALGRYESRELITDLLPLIATVPSAADAIVHAFRGPEHPADRNGEQMQRFVDVVTTLAVEDDEFVSVAAVALGDLTYDHPAVAASGLGHLRQLLRRAETNPNLGLRSIVAAIETFVRKSNRIAPIGDDLIERLRFIATANAPRFEQAAAHATAALVLAGAIDVDTLRLAVADRRDPRRRYLSALALGRAATSLDDAERTAMLRRLLTDDEISVRIEAARSWARQSARTEGCDDLLGLLDAPHARVVLVTLDLLGDACRESPHVTDRLAAESARTPPTNGSWHRPVHAFVSLSKRAPERVMVPLRTSYVTHPTWQVRMYAARIATALKDLVVLERLALDREDNVREAALSGLRELKGAESDPMFVAALQRHDYQLLRRAALELKGAARTPELANALLRALLRVTAEQKDTSRDTRLALIERIAELGYPDQAEHLGPLLRDFDIRVAMTVASVMEGWTGRQQAVDPRPLPRPPLPHDAELDEDLDAVVTLQNGRRFGISLRAGTARAPLTVTRFKRLIRQGYYDGLTFHRVVPNFVIQGGSPGANEYVGDGPFMRDEIGGSHAAYSVGVSTRGRDTGDAQIFINLIDNFRLDDDYTVFGDVCEVTMRGSQTVPGEGRRAVDAILEGDRIRSIRLEKWEPCRTRG